MRGLLAVGFGVAAVAAAVTGAAAGVSVETGPGLKAKGSINPDGDTDAFVLDGVKGTTLSLKVKASGKSTLDPELRVVGPSGEVDPGGALVDAGSTVALQRFVLPASSRQWRFTVTGTGVGDYSLSLKAKAPSKAGDTILLPAAGSAEFEFSAPAGSLLQISVKPDRGSAAVPRLGILDGGGDVVDLSGEGKVGPTTQVVSVPVPGTGGDCVLTVMDGGDAGGGAVISVRIKAPRSKTEKVDARGVALGAPGGGETYVSKTIGAAGGDIASGGGGFLLEVPADALANDVRIAMVSAPPPTPPSANDQAAGPAIDLRPSGLQFSAPATLTLPWDPALLPGNADASDIRVLVVEGNGSTLELTPTSVDSDANTLTLPISGFSVCIPVVESGVPRLGLSPGGDEYWSLSLEFEVAADPGARDSRAREMLLDVGELSFFPDATVQFSSSARRISWRNDASPGGISHGLESTIGNFDSSATWRYGSDGRTIEIIEGDGGPVLAVSRDGSVMVAWEDNHGDEAEWFMLLRKPAQPLTAADLKGTWTFGGLELGASVFGSDSPATMDVRREFGTVTFDGNTGMKVTQSERQINANGGNGSLGESTEGGSLSATFEIQADGTVLLRIPPEHGDDEGDVLRLYPGRNGDVMFLTDDGPCGPCIFAAVLVRQSSGHSTASLDGDFVGSTLGVDLDSYAPDGGGGFDQFAGDPHFAILRFGVPFSGGSTAPLSGTESSLAREPNDDDGTPDGIRSVRVPFSTTLGLAVDAKGGVTMSPTGQPSLLRGAVSPDGMVVFFVSNPSVAGAEYVMGLMVKAPPLRLP